MTTWDFLVLACYLLALAAITWHFRKSSARPAEYFLAGRSLGALPIGLSVMVTTFSAVNYLAFPGEVYGYGLYVIASFPAFFLAALPVTRWWIPYFQKTRPVSVYAVLEEFFDLKVRLLCSALFLVWRIFWMAVALYASSRILANFSGWNLTAVIVFSALAAAVYSSIGGMKAVIWTDVMQFAVLFGSVLFAVAFALRGGDFWQTLYEAGRLQPFAPGDGHFLAFDPTERISLWSALLGSTVVFMTRFGGDQMVMQRCLAARSPEAAKRGLWLSGVASVLTLGCLALFGLALAAFARRAGLAGNTPPVKVISALLGEFPAGARGVLAAGLLAATMSSIDSGLNSASAAIATDFEKRLGWKHVRPGVMTFLLAIPITLAAAFWLPALNRDQSLFVILNKTVNVIGTPLLAVMTLAVFHLKLRPAAVFGGVLTGLAATIAVTIWVQALALHGYAVISLLASFGAMALWELVCWLWAPHR